MHIRIMLRTFTLAFHIKKGNYKIMKILHLILCNPFTEGMTYQENMLADAMADDGNQVYVITNCFVMKGGSIVKTEPCEKRLESGVTIYRYEYKKVINKFLTRKLRIAGNIIEKIKNLDPDILVMHGLQSLSEISVCNYADKYNKPIVADVHADYSNSGLGFISKNILHRIVYKIVAKRIEKSAKKIYYITIDSKDFIKKEYGLKNEKLKFLPLGGKILSDAVYYKWRKEIREEIGVKENEIVYVHTGKLDHLKKTDFLIEAFYKADVSNAVLIIVGTIDKSIKGLIDDLILDSRNKGQVRYLGWKSGEGVIKRLCAADVYVQPGGKSATFQNAMCCKCAMVSYPHKAYMNGYINGNCIWAKDEDELVETFKYIESHPIELKKMQKRSEKIAKEKLDYTNQSRMIIADCGY